MTDLTIETPKTTIDLSTLEPGYECGDDPDLYLYTEDGTPVARMLTEVGTTPMPARAIAERICEAVQEQKHIETLRAKLQDSHMEQAQHSLGKQDEIQRLQDRIEALEADKARQAQHIATLSSRVADLEADLAMMLRHAIEVQDLHGIQGDALIEIGTETLGADPYTIPHPMQDEQPTDA